MNYPKILNKQGELLAILNEIKDINIKKKINSEYSLSISTVISELKSEHINENNQIEIEDNLFNIIDYELTHQGNDEVYIDIYAEQVITELLDIIVENFDYTNRTGTEILNLLFANTNFTLRNCNKNNRTHIQYKEEANKMRLLQAIGNNWRGEFNFDRYNVDFLNEIGNDTGVQFRYGKNLRGIKKSIKGSEKDELGNPSVTYQVDIIELDELSEFRGLESFNLGDRVRVIDEVLGIDVELRILELTYNPVRRINTNVVLGSRLKTFTQDYVMEVQEKYEDLSQKLGGVEIKISDSSIIATVLNSDEYKTDKSTFEQTATGITLSVSSLNNKVTGLEGDIQSTQSSISILSDSIESKVSQTDYNGNTIASMINQTATTIKLQASKIDLTGITTMYSTSNPGSTFARFGGNVFELFGYANKMYEIDLSNVNVTVFRAFGKTMFEYVDFYQQVEAVGKWDFSRATVTGLTAAGTVAKFG